ncbi:hypothetical protein EJ06DRAFT_62765 [Trichodelitschia bisporula]|uniref:Uncharacterized protein n=1 Tax=Trichodelitschia bisporula TaxID=703511 RepID=A0A6G1HVE1_9PEZI|nr:hypothetical protein EJ06DRAFT_62765 [Trichodelitschia bisporula]
MDTRDFTTVECFVYAHTEGLQRIASAAHWDMARQWIQTKAWTLGRIRVVVSVLEPDVREPSQMSRGSAPLQMSRGSAPSQISRGSAPSHLSCGFPPSHLSRGSALSQMAFGPVPSTTHFGSAPPQMTYGSNPFPRSYGSGPQSRVAGVMESPNECMLDPNISHRY